MGAAVHTRWLLERKAAAPPAGCVLLHEDRTLEFAPLQAGKPRVDRQLGIIYGVKVIGRSSPNTHGEEGVEGTDYEPTALTEALSLVEDKGKVNQDHPSRQEPDKDRETAGRIGKIRSCRMIDGEMYGDLYYLRSHPMAERLCESAERPEMNDCFALSLNAYGRGVVKNRRYVITKIVKVNSIDLVCNGGTNKSLFESAEGGKMKKSLRQLVESAAAGAFPKLRKLLEAYGDSVAALEMDGDGKDECDHLLAAFKVLKEKDPEKANKVLAMLKADVGGIEESDEDEDMPPKKSKEDEDKEKKVEESLKKKATGLCGLAGIEPAKELLESMVATRTNGGMIRLLNYVKTLLPARAGETPKSAPASVTAGATVVQESRGFTIPEKAEDRLTWLMN